MIQFLLYCVFGGLGVVTDFLVYVGLMGIGVAYAVANVAGYASGTLVSFVLNRRLNFKVLDHVVRRIVLFFAVAAIGLGVSTLLLWVMIDLWAVDATWAKIITLPVIVVLQFSLNRFVTFRTQTSTTTTSISEGTDIA